MSTVKFIINYIDLTFALSPQAIILLIAGFHVLARFSIGTPIATLWLRPNGIPDKVPNPIPWPDLALFGRAVAASGMFILIAFSFPSQANGGDPIVVAQDAREQINQNSPCTGRLQEFVAELDRLLDKNPDSVADVSRILKRYLPISGCNVEAAIAAAKQSKYFTAVYDWGPAYTVSFNSRGFEVSFAVRKNTGDIELPAARVKCGGKDCL